MPTRFSIVMFVAVLTVAGCGPRKRGTDRICPGAESVNKVLFELRLGFESAVALRANGQCRLKLRSPKKEHKENVVVKLWVNPPDEIYLQGDIAFNAKGIVVGCNKEEFWLVTRPKELRQYVWGRWDRQQGSNSRLALSPRLLLEALGTVAVGPYEDSSVRWSLSNEGAHDILTGRNQAGEIVKKLYVNTCDRRISKIEYFDADDRLAATTELDRYRDVAAGFAVPTHMRMVRHRADDKEDSVRLTLSPPKRLKAPLSDKARQRFFTRPPSRGIEQVEIVDGKPVAEPEKN
jgi:hypothetical protein